MFCALYAPFYGLRISFYIPNGDKAIHGGPEQKEGFTNYTKRSDNIMVAVVTALTNPMYGQIIEFVFLRKSFFLFWGVPKNFFDLQSLLWP